MRQGEAWRMMVAAVERGYSPERVAWEWGRNPRYVRAVMRKYAKVGSAMFEDGREYRKESLIPRQDDKLVESLRVKREMGDIAKRIAVGDRVRVTRGSGREGKIVADITVEYVGKSFVAGRTKRGYRMAISFYEIWKEEHKGEGHNE